MSNPQLYFGDSSSDNDDIFDPASDASLPFPKPLDRSSFLTPAFSAAEYLSTLTTRFQTLEDLQSELQDRLNSLNKDLVDLVNDNYTSFLDLGQKLSGGEERIEQVRVGLLGFQRDVAGLRDIVDARAQRVRTLLEQKRLLGKHLQLGRTLLDVDERITDLEERLSLTSESNRLHESHSTNDEEDDADTLGDFQNWSDDWSHKEDFVLSDDDADSDHLVSDLPRHLRKNVEDFLILHQISKTCGQQHPFMRAQSDRVNLISNILRRDMEAAIRAQKDVKVKQKTIQLKAKLEDQI